MKHLLSLVALLSMCGNLVTVYAFGLDMFTLSQTVACLFAFTLCGYVSTYESMKG